MQEWRVMLKIIAVGYIPMIYLARAVKMLEFVRVEGSDLQDRDSETKRQQDEQYYDYTIYRDS